MLALHPYGLNVGSTMDERVRLGCRNLIETYLALGRKTGNLDLVEQEGGSFQVCTGKVPHPVCNFALDLHLDDCSAARLGEIASSRQTFNVYHVPTDTPDDVGSRLRECGFKLSCSLLLMAAQPRKGGSYVQLEAVLDPKDREAVARFMARLFFAHQPEGVRRCVAAATAKAGVELYVVRDGKAMIAAAMLSPLGGAHGLYNLCVTPSWRRRAIGSGIVSTLMDVTSEKDDLLLLQCDPSMEGWYIQQGFESIGNLEVYALPKIGLLDIIG